MADRIDSRASGQDASATPGNFVTYAQTQLDTFGERPFCAVDSLVLSWISYFRLPEEAEAVPGLIGWEGAPATDLLLADWIAGK